MSNQQPAIATYKDNPYHPTYIDGLGYIMSIPNDAMMLTDRRQDEPVSVEEAATMVRLFPSTVYHHIYHNNIKARKVGGRWFLRRGDVEEFIRSRQ